jgi:Lrp/AsnC family leucine-responsive transcriptional regulator
MSTNEDSQINNKSKRKYKLDDIDIAILNNLQQNARISNIDLANTVGISASPCLRRVKNLIDSNIIENFKTTLNKN